jgi:hypothetical protein
MAAAQGTRTHVTIMPSCPGKNLSVGARQPRFHIPAFSFRKRSSLCLHSSFFFTISFRRYNIIPVHFFACHLLPTVFFLKKKLQPSFYSSLTINLIFLYIWQTQEEDSFFFQIYYKKYICVLKNDGQNKNHLTLNKSKLSS